VYPNSSALRTGFAKPIVKTLFWTSCLLSIVSFYTTQQGMALYLSSWFSIIAALGIQLSLVMVAWLIGFSRKSRVLLTIVYAITAVVSVAFSYVSLHKWFSERERPALMRRQLYDELTRVAAQSEQLLTEAAAKGRGYVLALQEMTAAEKSHGRISRSRDDDPYLDRIREAVRREAQSLGAGYGEGSGEGVRYTAFERFTRLAERSTADVESARQAIARVKTDLSPAMATEEQLRRFRRVYDSLPWTAVAELRQEKSDIPPLPAYADYVEQSATGQEDLMRAFEGLAAPTSRQAFALALAAFIDIIVFLLAWSSGPYFYGETEDQWIAAGATLDSTDDQVFARDLLRKFRPGRSGMPRVDASTLTAGEQQFLLLLTGRGVATAQSDDTGEFYLVDTSLHERLIQSLASPGLNLRAAPQRT
jgi:hypothetical protein